jgi:cytochrome oxidase Cu insertion factor (SCO1/SenC/PrrC family)
MLRFATFGLAATSVAGFSAHGGSLAMRTTGRSMSNVNMATFYDFSANTIDGKETSMADFKGKPVLILNVASL